jgi:hypothetical protein
MRDHVRKEAEATTQTAEAAENGTAPDNAEAEAREQARELAHWARPHGHVRGVLSGQRPRGRTG